MELKIIKCPVCGGKIKIQEDADTVTCEFCNTEFYVEENNPDRLMSKVRLKEIEHETARTKMFYDDKADHRRMKMEEKREETRSAFAAFLFPIILILLLGLGVFGYLSLRTKSLEKTVSEIQEDIDNERFDEARIKVESLRDSEFSGEEKKRWKETRKQLTKQIDEAEKAAIIAKSITVPAASSKIKGMNYNEVVTLFEDAGFTSINSIESNDKAGFFHEAGDVKDISIGGDSRFKEGDLFLPDSPVTIYYYKE